MGSGLGVSGRIGEIEDEIGSKRGFVDGSDTGNCCGGGIDGIAGCGCGIGRHGSAARG